MFNNIIPPAKKITRSEANARIMVIEEMIHKLMRDCAISGMTETANALDVLTNYTDDIYIAIAEKD
jgi:hypothetical protein